MSALRDIQRAFVAHLFDADAGAVLAGVGHQSLTPAECLNIHRNNTFITLHEALAALYPVLQALVGEAFFTDLARDFAHRFPPRSGNLHDFGRELHQVVGDDPRLSSLPCLADVARLEWTLHEVFHGPDARALDADALRAAAPDAWPALRLRLHPGCRLLHSPFPVLTIWQAHQSRPVPERIDLGAGGEQVLVVRPHLEVALHRLDPAQHALLCALGEGATLQDAAEAALAIDPAFDLQALLHECLAGGVFTGARTGPAPH